METTTEKTPLQLAEDLRFKILLLASNMKYAKEQWKGIEVELKANITNVDVEVFKELGKLCDQKIITPDENFNQYAFSYTTEHCRILISSKEIN